MVVLRGGHEKSHTSYRSNVFIMFWYMGVEKGLVVLMTSGGGEGYWSAKLSKSEFSRYVKVTDRLAELRGLKATRELTKAEQTEYGKLRQEYESLLKLGRKKKH